MRHERSECRIARRCPLSAQVEYEERERPGREADLRYSAGRAQRGRGRFPLLLMALHVRSRGWRHHGRERGPFGELVYFEGI